MAKLYLGVWRRGSPALPKNFIMIKNNIFLVDLYKINSLIYLDISSPTIFLIWLWFWFFCCCYSISRGRGCYVNVFSRWIWHLTNRISWIYVVEDVIGYLLIYDWLIFASSSSANDVAVIFFLTSYLLSDCIFFKKRWGLSKEHVLSLIGIFIKIECFSFDYGLIVKDRWLLFWFRFIIFHLLYLIG